jgi:predicted PurR-regulated permease PerM
MEPVPTPFQRKILWAAITAFSFVILVSVIALAGWLLIGAMSYLQPVLIPIAIASILAYLLEPVVRWLVARRMSRTLAVITVFLMGIVAITGLVTGILPAALRQGESLGQNLPGYTEKAQALVGKTVDRLNQLSKERFLQKTQPETPSEGIANYISDMVDKGLIWLQQESPNIAISTGKFLQRSVGGFLGIFGFLLSLILVPIFLFFFLKEGKAISDNWSKYLPLRASPLKNEIVSLFTEINNYLINFFRGQLIVSLIDGALVAICLLVFLRLEFSLVIGLLVGVLGLIPYAGVFIVWIPAVIIAAAQYGDWIHPMWVTLIFIGVNQLDSLFIAPKIVGESVGLHPLTVIISVLAWSLILGGLLGALLAVPLTAALKVLLKRYFWDRPSSGTLKKTEKPTPTRAVI